MNPSLQSPSDLGSNDLGRSDLGRSETSRTIAGQDELPPVPGSRPGTSPQRWAPPDSPLNPIEQLRDNVRAENALNRMPTNQPAVGALPRRIPPPPMRLGRAEVSALERTKMEWWPDQVSQQVLDRPRWVTFDLQTVLLDALQNSPRIQSVSHRTATAMERIVQQDAAFDPSILLSGNLGRTNDPVGSTLITGGADRLVEESVSVQGGFRRTTRRGTEIEVAQQLGLTDSNSEFFVPRDQGDSRLSLSLTKPLLDRGGQVYNERLITQARIDSRVAWQEMRSEVEQRIAEVITAYWQLYQLRCEVSQQRDLLSRGQAILRVLNSRKDFDTGRIEITKAQQRIARRDDQLLSIEAELRKQQSRLAVAIGSDALLSGTGELEMIPVRPIQFPEMTWNVRDCVARALEYRPEIRAATHELELSSLEMTVTRAELVPQLNAVFNGYLSALNGESQVGRSLIEQFENGPGVSAALEYEMPRGNRAARSRVREAQQRYRQRAASLQDVIQQTQFEVESALIDVQTALRAQQKKQLVLETAIHEENILYVRWQTVGGDGSRIGILLENLLDAQQRRTDAERDWVATQTTYLTAIVGLQRAMGTLLINEGIRPQRFGHCEVQFIHDETDTVPQTMSPITPHPTLPIDEDSKR